MSEQIPSFSERLRNLEPVRPSDAMRRLFWAIQGPLETSISVLTDPINRSGQRDPYFRQTEDGTSWHPISQESVLVPEVSSILVRVTFLDEFPDWWATELHRHASSDTEELVGCVFQEVDGERILKRCCNETRPADDKPLLVTTSSHPYVTVHDYLSAVHPWLIEQRLEISQAVGNMTGETLSPDSMVVNHAAPESLDIMDEQDWVQPRIMSTTQPMGQDLFTSCPEMLQLFENQ